MEIINCTPHAIVLRSADGDTTFPPSGIVPRIKVDGIFEVAGFGMTPVVHTPSWGLLKVCPGPYRTGHRPNGHSAGWAGRGGDPLPDLLGPNPTRIFY